MSKPDPRRPDAQSTPKPAPPPAPRAKPDWKALACGGLLTLLALTGLVVTGLGFTAETRFHKISGRLQGATLTPEQLSEYAREVNDCLRLDPSNGEMRNAYANMLGRLEEYLPALRQLEQARRTLNDRTTLYYLSSMHQHLGEIARAEQYMSDCLIINPTDVEFNPALLQLLGMRLVEMNMQKSRLQDLTLYNQYRHRYAAAALGWSIRAANDKNSFLFLGNYYMDPLFGQQAYRCFMVGLSEAPWLNLNPRLMVNREGVLATVHRLVSGRFARPYKNMP